MRQFDTAAPRLSLLSPLSVLRKMIIAPTVGIDDIRFGMTKLELVSLLGVPTKEIEDEYGDLTLCYESRGFALKIETKNESRLGWIEVSNPEAAIFGFRVIGKRKEEVLRNLHNELGESEDREDYGTWTSTTFEGSWIEIQETLGWVTQINFGVTYDESEKPRWLKERKVEPVD